MESIENTDLKNELIVFAKKVTDTDHPQEFLDEAIKLARHEESLGITGDYFKDVSVSEIADFGKSIEGVSTMDEKYKLMMQKSESGEMWYDILLGEGNSKLFNLVMKKIQKNAEKYGAWKTAADIGTGTGNILRSIAMFCKKIYGVDLNYGSLKVAKENNLPANASLIDGSAEHLPFPNHSLDFVVGNGLIYYFSKEQTVSFVHELSRVIKKHGKYYFSYHVKEKDEIVPKLSKNVLESAKAALVDIVAEMATGGGHPESLYPRQYNDLLLENGFRLSDFQEEKENNTVFVEYTSV